MVKREETREAKRLREIILGKRSFEPEDLALFGVGAVVATVAPSPADMLYFYVERWLDDHRYELSPTKYWLYRAANYYFTDTAWHMGLLLWILFSHRPVSEKAEIYFSMIAAGATVAILFDFIRDETEKRKVRDGGAVEKKAYNSCVNDWEAVL